MVSNETYNKYTNLLIVVPITNTDDKFPLHVELDERTKTTGVILCEHIKSIDQKAMKIIKIEELPKDMLAYVIAIVQSELDMKL